MKFTTLFTFSAALLFSRTSACEQDCRGNITRVFVTKYAPKITKIFNDLQCDLSATTTTNHKRFFQHNLHRRSYSSIDIHGLEKRASCQVTGKVSKAVQSIQMDFLNTREFKILKNAVFKFIRGNCVPKGTKAPKGCPNYDCPVVCGSPGSLIHFYPTVFNYANGNLTKSLSSLFGNNGDYAKSLKSSLGNSATVKSAIAKMITRIHGLCKNGCSDAFKHSIIKESKKWP